MKRIRVSRVVLGVLFVLGLFAVSVQSAQAITIGTPSGYTLSSGLPVNATASFTLNEGSISLTLTNLLSNPTSIAQLISGITFNVSGASGSGKLTTVNSGLLCSISDGGAYTTGASDSLTRWTASHWDTLIKLTTLSGGQPDRLIIGPADEKGKYSAANDSIWKSHDPSVLGSATFNITIPGVTSTSTLSNVTFLFGSGPEAVPVPIPGALLLFGPGVAGLIALRRRIK
jgi:hypothetical protein